MVSALRDVYNTKSHKHIDSPKRGFFSIFHNVWAANFQKQLHGTKIKKLNPKRLNRILAVGFIFAKVSRKSCPPRHFLQNLVFPTSQVFFCKWIALQKKGPKVYFEHVFSISPRWYFDTEKNVFSLFQLFFDLMRWKSEKKFSKKSDFFCV